MTRHVTGNREPASAAHEPLKSGLALIQAVLACAGSSAHIRAGILA
jgi:hypothetical protein